MGKPSERALSSRLRVIAAHFDMTLEELAIPESRFAHLLASRASPSTPTTRPCMSRPVVARYSRHVSTVLDR